MLRRRPRSPLTPAGRAARAATSIRPWQREVPAQGLSLLAPEPQGMHLSLPLWYSRGGEHVEEDLHFSTSAGLAGSDGPSTHRNPSTMSPLRIDLVRSGFAVSRHSYAWHCLPRFYDRIPAEVTRAGICSSIPESPRLAKARLGATSSFRTVGEMALSRGIDVIDACPPTGARPQALGVRLPRPPRSERAVFSQALTRHRTRAIAGDRVRMQGLRLRAL